MIYIGLDLATKKTGCCVIDNEKLIYYDCIRCGHEKDSYYKRIKDIGNQLDAVIKKFKPDKIFIEDAPIMKNSSASMLCVMQGYILCIIDKYNIPYELYQPSSWRKTIGIEDKNGNKKLKGDEPKIETIRYINDRFGLNLIYKKDSVKSQDDIADSIGIACCGIAREKDGKRNV